MQTKMAKYCLADVPTPNILIDHQCFFSFHTNGKMIHSGGGTQAEPDGHNINKTACHQITSYTVDLSNFSPTLIYAP